MEHFGLTQRFILTAILGGGLGTTAAALWWFAAGERLRSLAPAPRLRRLIAMALMPFAGALGLVGIVALPSILHATGVAADHCGAHPAHHVHLCLIHTGHAHASSIAWLAIGAGAVWFGVRTLPAVGEWIRARRELSPLRREAEFDGRDGAEFVASRTPFAATVGWFAPRVLVSEALWSELSEAQCEVVLAHERVHARRYHTLLQAAATLVGLLHLPPVRTFLEREIDLTCEQIADREAARRTGGAVEVADTILEVERLFREADPPTGARPSIDGSSLEQRIRGLLEEPWRPTNRYVGLASTLVALCGVVGSYDSIHHGLETLFSLLL